MYPKKSPFEIERFKQRTKKPIFDRKKSDAKVMRFMQSKEKVMSEKDQHKAKLEQAVENWGFTDYMFPRDSSLRIEKRNGSTPQHRSVSAMSTNSALSTFEPPDCPRGLQSFDLAKNPEVEQLIKPVIGSIKADETSFFGKPKKTPFTSSLPSTGSTRKYSLEIETTNRNEIESTSTTQEPEVIQTFTDTHPSPNEVKKFIFEHAISKMSYLMRINKQTDMPWLEERLDLSSRSCRFELPMDVLELGPMTPLKYLSKYCRVSRQRQNSVYLPLFNKNLPEKKDKFMPFDKLEHCLKALLLDLVPKSDLKKFLKFVNVGHNTTVDFQLFKLLACLSERLLYAGCANIKEQRRYSDPRSFLEIADFSYLSNKLAVVKFNSPHLKTLLFSLC